MPNGCRSTAPDPSNSLLTSPPKSFSTIGVCGPCHVSFADVTLHLTPNQPHVLEEMNHQFLVTKKLHKKNPVRCTVFPYHTTSVGKPQQRLHLLQTILILHNLLHLLNHFLLPKKHNNDTSNRHNHRLYTTLLKAQDAAGYLEKVKWKDCQFNGKCEMGSSEP